MSEKYQGKEEIMNEVGVSDVKIVTVKAEEEE